MNHVTLVTGGGRSGKSRYALERALGYAVPRAFIATAEPFDDEMKERIRRHQDERGSTFETLEVPRHLGPAIAGLKSGTTVALVDCLTVWLNNLMYYHGEGARSYPEVAEFVASLRRAPCDVILVTNELGMGMIPTDSALSRRYRDQAGWLNQEVARAADEVVFVVSGIPMTIKGKDGSR